MSGRSIASQRPWQIVHCGREQRCCEASNLDVAGSTRIDPELEPEGAPTLELEAL